MPATCRTISSPVYWLWLQTRQIPLFTFRIVQNGRGSHQGQDEEPHAGSSDQVSREHGGKMWLLHSRSGARGELAVSNSPGSFCKDARTYINGRDQLSQIHSPWSDCLEARPHYCYLEGFLSLTVKKNVFANWTQKLLSSLNFIQCSKKIFSRILIFVILGLLKIYVCYFAWIFLYINVGRLLRTKV